MLVLSMGFLIGNFLILLEEQFRAKKKRATTANIQLPNTLSCRRWELGIERCELTRAL